jgi:hypothetical protein
VRGQALQSLASLHVCGSRAWSALRRTCIVCSTGADTMPVLHAPPLCWYVLTLYALVDADPLMNWLAGWLASH